MKLLIFGVLLLHAARGVEYELRIHEGAEPGERLTTGIEMQRKLQGMSNCFGQLETDVEWLEYRSSRNAFYTLHSVGEADPRTAHDLTGTLHLLCAGNKMHSLAFHVHVTRTNRHPPTFEREEYHFYVPVALAVGEQVAKLQVTDQDPVIYNSQRQLSFTKDEPLFNVFADGTITLKDGLAAEMPYRPIKMQILAIDYGSPQLFTLANVTITPVTVSEVRDLRVNVATDFYQVFEWDTPQYGHADKYRLTIRKKEQVVYEEEIDGKHNIALTKVAINLGEDFTYRISSVDVGGETPSDWARFTILNNALRCEGDCAGGGGVPLCYYGTFNRVQQFTDALGAHCQCHPGYSGVACERTDTCLPEKSVEPWGGVDWREADVNATVAVPCPYNSDGEILHRVCEWDRVAQRAGWEKLKGGERCKTQSSVLTHLGMLGTFAGRAESVSTVHTVARFLRTLLTVPAFSPNASSEAHFDKKIAEHTAQVIDSVLRVNFTNLRGNSSQVKDELRSISSSLSLRLPVPFSLASPDLGLHLHTLHWMRGGEHYRQMIGGRCHVQLSVVADDNVLRTVCMANGSFYDTLDTRNPVLSLSTDEPLPTPFTKVTFGLKPFDQRENYTCVWYDEQAEDWSTRGVRLVARDVHGFVVCETQHMATFSILPERLFTNEDGVWRDVAAVLPTVSTFIAVICAVFTLFLASIQKSERVDLALLLYLFAVFLIHGAHLVMIIGPQIGDPFLLSPALHLVLQFAILCCAAMLCLIVSSIHELLSSEKDHPTACARPCLVFSMGIAVPGVLTFSTYYFADNYKHDLARVLSRVDWLFLANYLCPAVLFVSMAVAFAVWNMYSASERRSKHRDTEERFLALSPALNASTCSLLVVAFLGAVVVLFPFRLSSPIISLLFACAQLLYSLAAFLFAGYVFRMRLLSTPLSSAGSTRSLERKRDISRALLDHVDARSPLERADVVSVNSEVYHSSLYERQPMVSIV